MIPELKTDEKSGIMYRAWDAQDPKAVALLVHGLGAHTGRWEFLADYLQTSGIASYALELRGFGQTQGQRGDIDSFKAYYRDIRTLRDIIAQAYPVSRVFLLGESMGSLIAFHAGVLDESLCDGLILITPAIKNVLPVSFLTYIDIFSSRLYNPRKSFKVPLSADMVTRDSEYIKVIDADHSEHRIASARMFFEILLAGRSMEKLLAQYRKSILIFITGRDLIVDSAPVKRLFNRIPAADKKMIEYQQMYHGMSIDLDRERVFADIVQWIGQRSSGGKA